MAKMISEVPVAIGKTEVSRDHILTKMEDLLVKLYPRVSPDLGDVIWAWGEMQLFINEYEYEQ